MKCSSFETCVFTLFVNGPLQKVCLYFKKIVLFSLQSSEKLQSVQKDNSAVILLIILFRDGCR